MVNLEVDPKKELGRALLKAAKDGADLRIPLGLIAQQWFKSNRAIFALKGPGKYVDLSKRYKAWKTGHLGSAYPIMRLTGALEASITEPSNDKAIFNIINQNSLVVGTSVDYANYHANPSPGSHMPQRPVVLFGNEQVAPGALSGRVEQWKQIIGDWVAAQSGAK